MKILNKKGFTLVELLAVIVILSIIALIAYPIIGNTINNSRDKLQKEQYNRVKNAAKNWATKNAGEEASCVSIADLKSGGYLEDVRIEDPADGKEMNGSFQIEWKDSNNQYEYTYYLSSNCTGKTAYNGL